MICGNLTNQIRRLLPFTSSNAQILSFLSPMDSLSSGHIQVAQVPHRHEPNSTGEIDYQYVFNLLNSVGYDEFIGLEYVPAGTSLIRILEYG